MSIFKLSKEIVFPSPELSDEDGLLAIGGDLSLERLIVAYCNGIFPWYNKGEPILWWCPKPRFIITPNEVKISKSMKNAYINLFKHGYAMSVETYLCDELVGGLYGVKIGKCFFGESMFSKVSNASKIALIKLAEKLANEDFIFIDCQMHTEHLESMGGKFVEWSIFKDLMNKGINL